MKLLYIDYAGDFAEAYNRLVVNKGKENYYGQRYTVNAVVDQARRGIDVNIITLNTSGYDQQLEPNLKVKGFLEGTPISHKAIFDEVTKIQPDRIVLRYPDARILRYCRKRGIPVLPSLADSFQVKSVFSRSYIRKLLLARELSHKSIRWVMNHQVNAAKSLLTLGVPATKILPYDWVHDDNPSNWSKKLPEDIANKRIELFFAGSIMKTKGVFDLVLATKYVKNSGRDVLVRIAGRGALDELQAYVNSLDIAENVALLGPIDHDSVLSYMNQSDAVVVPSHHIYPEGLPMTIMESLMVHTPVVASDHPMFVGRVGKRGAVRFFREQNAKDLADVVLSVCHSDDQYRLIIENTSQEWFDLNLELKSADIIDQWVADPMGSDFSQHSLAALVEKGIA
jgi:glycosyltransferase involved in cell wall biosynthesis